MFEKIYIHIGLPKTGSTAIQNCMEALSRAGELKVVSYPVFGAERDWQSIESGNGAAIAELLAPDITPEFCAVRLQEAFYELLGACEPSSRVLVISSEHFFSAAAERFLLFKELLLKHAVDIELIMCARPLSEMCYSAYHQFVKRHGCSLSYGSEWFSIFVGDLLFSRFESIGQWGVDGSVVRYKKQGLLGDFLSVIGEESNLAARFENRRVNRSLTESELDLMLKINAVFESKPLSMRISDRWIYARPEVSSFETVHDVGALYELFHLEVSARKDLYKIEAVRKLIEILGFGSDDGNDQSVCVGGGAGNKEAQSDELLLMALDEIKHFMGLEAELGAYTNQLKVTKEAFDPVHYLLLNRDVLAAGVDPVWHYKEFGAAEGRVSAYNLTNIFVSE